jgi:hypothetical protein
MEVAPHVLAFDSNFFWCDDNYAFQDVCQPISIWLSYLMNK